MPLVPHSALHAPGTPARALCATVLSPRLTPGTPAGTLCPWYSGSGSVPLVVRLGLCAPGSPARTLWLYRSPAPTPTPTAWCPHATGCGSVDFVKFPRATALRAPGTLPENQGSRWAPRPGPASHPSIPPSPPRRRWVWKCGLCQISSGLSASCPWYSARGPGESVGPAPAADKSLDQGLTFNRSQRGSCSATYESLTQNQVVCK